MFYAGITKLFDLKKITTLFRLSKCVLKSFQHYKHILKKATNSFMPMGRISCSKDCQSHFFTNHLVFSTCTDTNLHMTHLTRPHKTGKITNNLALLDVPKDFFFPSIFQPSLEDVVHSNYCISQFLHKMRSGKFDSQILEEFMFYCYLFLLCYVIIFYISLLVV